MPVKRMGGPPTEGVSMTERVAAAIEKQFGETVVIREFTLLHEGWEMDNKAWLIKTTDGSLHLIFTSHGGMYEASTAELRSQIDMLLDAVAAQQAVLAQLEGQADIV
jgi:hypothetical protein